MMLTSQVTGKGVVNHDYNEILPKRGQLNILSDVIIQGQSWASSFQGQFILYLIHLGVFQLKGCPH